MNQHLSPLTAVHRWAVHAQLKARRNAMGASTELARHRAERLEVEDYLAARAVVPLRLRQQIGRSPRAARG